MRNFFFIIFLLTGVFMSGFLADFLFSIDFLSDFYNYFESWHITFVFFMFFLTAATVDLDKMRKKTGT